MSVRMASLAFSSITTPFLIKKLKIKKKCFINIFRAIMRIVELARGANHPIGRDIGETCFVVGGETMYCHWKRVVFWFLFLV